MMTHRGEHERHGKLTGEEEVVGGDGGPAAAKLDSVTCSGDLAEVKASGAAREQGGANGHREEAGDSPERAVDGDRATAEEIGRRRRGCFRWLRGVGSLNRVRARAARGPGGANGGGGCEECVARRRR